MPNALAAAAVGAELDVPLETAAAVLAEARITRWRMQTSGTPEGIRVVNDAYNANPESVAAALKTGRWMAAHGRLIAVLGQMAELGPIATAEHERVGELAARLPVDRLLAIGPDAKAIAVAAVRGRGGARCGRGLRRPRRWRSPTCSPMRRPATWSS